MAQTKILLDTNSYGVKTWTTLELMNSMFDAGHVSLEQIQRVVEQWVHDKDLPAKVLRSPFKKFFGAEPPMGF